MAALGFVLLAADLFTFFAGELSIDGYGDLAVANNLALLMAAPLPVAAIIAGLFVGTARPKGVG